MILKPTREQMKEKIIYLSEGKDEDGEYFGASGIIGKTRVGVWVDKIKEKDPKKIAINAVLKSLSLIEQEGEDYFNRFDRGEIKGHELPHVKQNVYPIIEL